MATITEECIISEEGEIIVTRKGAGRMWQYFVSATRAIDAALTDDARRALCDQTLAHLTPIITTGRIPASVG